MTEQELVSSMQSLTSAAQSVLQAIQSYGSQATGNVTFQIGGTTYTLKALQQQLTDSATQASSDRLAYMKSFNGTPINQVVERDSVGRLYRVTTVYYANFSTVETIARDTNGKISTVTVVCKDPLGNVLDTSVKTINRVNNKYVGVE